MANKNKTQPDMNGKSGNRRGLFNKGFASSGMATLIPVLQLAIATDTPPILFAALKSTYGWTDKTRLQHENFLRLRDKWLKKPVGEVRS